jgi:hypothetical protein
MASFVAANLDHEVKGGFVVFKLDTKLRFESNEVNHKWLFQIEFMEADPVKDDPLSRVPDSVGFADSRFIRHYFVPSQEEIDLAFEEEFPAHLVDTEMGKEEVYANLQVLPLEAPPGFVPAKTRTNITHVDV